MDNCSYARKTKQGIYVCSLKRPEYCYFQRYCGSDNCYKFTSGAQTCIARTHQDKQNGLKNESDK